MRNHISDCRKVQQTISLLSFDGVVPPLIDIKHVILVIDMKHVVLDRLIGLLCSRYVLDNLEVKKASSSAFFTSFVFRLLQGSEYATYLKIC